MFGPYEVVPDWPRPMSESLPGHEQWTYSVTMDVFAESPNRVLVASKGELPLIEKRPESIWLPQLGPGLQFPVFRLPLRQAGGGVPNGDQLDQPGNGRPGIDWRFEHSILVMNAEGKITEDWTQWDKMWTRPHDIEISPYDSEKHVWIVDAEGHGVYKFTNDGKKLLLTLGTPHVAGDDETHFRRPTFLVFMDANTMYLADGYDNTRVIKYDMDGKKLAQWGEKGRRRTRSVPASGTTCTALLSTRRHARCSSTIAPTAACRSSTRTASTFVNGTSVRDRRWTSTASS